MNRQSCHCVEQIFCGGYFFTFVFTCTHSFSLSLSPPVVLQLFFSPSQAVLVWQLCLGTSGKVDGGFVLLIAVNVLEVYHHVQGIGQDEEQD